MKAILTLIVSIVLSMSVHAHSVCITASAPCITSTTPVVLTGSINGFITPQIEWQRFTTGTWQRIAGNASVFTATEPGRYRLSVTEYGPGCYGQTFYSNELCITTCTVVPVSRIKDFTASATDDDVDLRWDVDDAQSVIVQWGSSSTTFVDVATVPAQIRRYTDILRGDGFYRITAIGPDGSKQVSEVVVIKARILSEEPATIAVYTFDGKLVVPPHKRKIANEAVLTQLIAGLVKMSGVYYIHIAQKTWIKTFALQL